jgi:hypothetical protein
MQLQRHPGGRPTKYSANLLKEAEKYIADHMEYGDKIPSIAGLSAALGISRETVYAWGKQEDKKEFSDMINRLLCAQERMLLNHGLDGTYHPTITKLLLGKHGYHDRPQQVGPQIQIIVNRDVAFLESGDDALGALPVPKTTHVFF